MHRPHQEGCAEAAHRTGSYKDINEPLQWQWLLPPPISITTCYQPLHGKKNVLESERLNKCNKMKQLSSRGTNSRSSWLIPSWAHSVLLRQHCLSVPSELHYCIRGVKGKRWELGRKKGNDGESESEGEREGEAEEDRKRKARIPFFDSSSTSIIKAESSLGWVKKMNLKGVTMWCFFLDQSVTIANRKVSWETYLPLLTFKTTSEPLLCI